MKDFVVIDIISMKLLIHHFLKPFLSFLGTLIGPFHKLFKNLMGKGVNVVIGLKSVCTAHVIPQWSYDFAYGRKGMFSSLGK